MQKLSNKKLKIFAAIAVIVLAGAAFWFFPRGIETFKPLNFFEGRADKSAPDQRNNQRDISELTETYTNPKYGFSFSYSKEFSVSEFAEGGGADVILISDAAAGGVFQILISPFDEPGPITKKRILKDIPDMAIADDKIISVGGVGALSFRSKDESGGETLEIWFVHNGNLYQISAFSSFGNKMEEIIKTWKFQ